MFATIFKACGVVAFTYFAWIMTVAIIGIFGLPGGFMIGSWFIGFPFIAAIVVFYLTCKLSVN